MRRRSILCSRKATCDQSRRWKPTRMCFHGPPPWCEGVRQLGSNMTLGGRQWETRNAIPVRKQEPLLCIVQPSKARRARLGRRLNLQTIRRWLPFHCCPYAPPSPLCWVFALSTSRARQIQLSLYTPRPDLLDFAVHYHKHLALGRYNERSNLVLREPAAAVCIEFKREPVHLISLRKTTHDDRLRHVECIRIITDILQSDCQRQTPDSLSAKHYHQTRHILAKANSRFPVLDTSLHYIAWGLVSSPASGTRHPAGFHKCSNFSRTSTTPPRLSYTRTCVLPASM